MDKHFVDTNPRHNLPVLLALTDIWNDILLDSSGRILSPFTQAFSGFPSFVGALEAQTCGGRVSNSSNSTGGKLSCSSTIVDGGLGCSYDRSIYQTSKVMNSELLMALDTQIAFNTSRTMGAQSKDEIYATQDSLICSLFAHADELAFGHEERGGSGDVPTAEETSEGNRPSLLLMPGKLDAFACGQLIALSEHRAIVKAHIWGLDPFVKEVGSSLRMHRTDQLKESLQELFASGPQDDDEEEDGADPKLNLSTKTILEHYAGSVREQRHQVDRESY